MSKDELKMITNRIEKNCIRLANFVIKDNEIMKFNLKILGASIIKFIRNLYNINPVWN